MLKLAIKSLFKISNKMLLCDLSHFMALKTSLGGGGQWVEGATSISCLLLEMGHNQAAFAN